MTYIPCCDRTFPLRINLANYYASYLHWLKHLGERFGYNAIIRLWEEVSQEYQASFLIDFLASGWSIEESATDISLRKMVTQNLASLPTDISPNDIEQLIRKTPPISILREKYADHTITKESSAYDALHLRFDFQANLAEEIIKNYGKQGEFVVYDILVEERRSASKGQTGSIEAFMDFFIAQPEQPNLFTAGIESELIHKTQTEVELHIRECEWARYFKDHHPEIGYLMACSTDEVAYQAFNKNLRMQRTETLMEGGKRCDFRIFSVSQSDNAEDATTKPDEEAPFKKS